MAVFEIEVGPVGVDGWPGEWVPLAVHVPRISRRYWETTGARVTPFEEPRLQAEWGFADWHVEPLDLFPNGWQARWARVTETPGGVHVEE